MNFKAWLAANETVMGSSGTDTQPAQTNKATDAAANSILSNPAFASTQAKLTTSGGSPSAQHHGLIDFATKGMNIVPKQIAPLTSAPAVAFSMQNQLGLKTSLPKPKFIKKWMTR